MAAFLGKEAALQQANAMSDHNAQVDATAKIVNQNLQGPYAIKPPSMSGQKATRWGFDLPDGNSSSCYSNTHYLAEKTGLSAGSCRALLGYMNNSSSLSKEDMCSRLRELAPYELGIGELLGQGKHRISVETDAAYETRMRLQIGALKNAVAGGANVLTIQEQPYDGLDPRRMAIFIRVMAEHGYVNVARLQGRDVGIWAKKELAHTFRSLAAGESLRGLVEAEPFRGCVVKDAQYLYINLHAYTVGRDQNQYVEQLIALKNAADAYAQRHGLAVTINGDMNLFRLSPQNKQKLEEQGFRVEPMKGQERYEAKSCEAYVQARTISPVARIQPVSFNAPTSSSAPQQSSSYNGFSFYSPPTSSSALSQPPVVSAVSSSQSSDSNQVILYKPRTPNPQLAVKFSSVQERTAFLEVMDSKMDLDIAYRKSWQFHGRDDSVLFIPAQIQNGQLVAQFSSLKTRAEFLKLLPQICISTISQSETELIVDDSSLMQPRRSITIQAPSFQKLADLESFYHYREDLNALLLQKRKEEPDKEKHYKSTFFGRGVGCSMEDKQNAVDLVYMWLLDMNQPVPTFNEDQRAALKDGDLARCMERVYRQYPVLKQAIESPVSQKQFTQGKSQN